MLEYSEQYGLYNVIYIYTQHIIYIVIQSESVPTDPHTTLPYVAMTWGSESIHVLKSSDMVNWLTTFLATLW